MVDQVTKGIKSSVKTTFEGSFYKNYKIQYAFGYTETIKKKRKDSVELNDSHCEILDALDNLVVISGESVIGKKSVLKPGDSHAYISGCLLTSPFGAMSGHYNM